MKHCGGSFQKKDNPDLHVVIFEHHRVLQLFLGLLIDFNLLVQLLVFVLPALDIDL